MLKQTIVRGKNTSLNGVITEGRGRELLQTISPSCHLHKRLSGLLGPLLIIRLVIAGGPCNKSDSWNQDFRCPCSISVDEMRAARLQQVFSLFSRLGITCINLNDTVSRQ